MDAARGAKPGEDEFVRADRTARARNAVSQRRPGRPQKFTDEQKQKAAARRKKAEMKLYNVG